MSTTLRYTNRSPARRGRPRLVPYRTFSPVVRSGDSVTSLGDIQSGDQLRKDAKRNRVAILDAARELFAESGDVAMSEVARRAGVGQATLYRNFPDRSALAAEVLSEHVERVAAIAGEHAG